MMFAAPVETEIATVTIGEQINAARREYNLRRRVYPRWVEQGRITAEKAQAETLAMAAILRTLEQVAGVHPSQQGRLL